MVDVVEILSHWYSGRSKNAVARSLGVHRATVVKYVRRGEDAGIAPGGPPISEEQWRGLVRQWFPELVDRRLRRSSWPS